MAKSLRIESFFIKEPVHVKKSNPKCKLAIHLGFLIFQARNLLPHCGIRKDHPSIYQERHYSPYLLCLNLLPRLRSILFRVTIWSQCLQAKYTKPSWTASIRRRLALFYWINNGNCRAQGPCYSYFSLSAIVTAIIVVASIESSVEELVSTLSDLVVFLIS